MGVVMPAEFFWFRLVRFAFVIDGSAKDFGFFSVCKGWLWSLALVECVYCFWWDGYFHEVNYYNLWAWEVFRSLCVFFTSLTQDLKFLSLWLGIVLGLSFSSGLFSWFSPCIPVTAIWEDYWFFFCVNFVAYHVFKTVYQLSEIFGGIFRVFQNKSFNTIFKKFLSLFVSLLFPFLIVVAKTRVCEPSCFVVDLGGSWGHWYSKYLSFRCIDSCYFVNFVVFVILVLLCFVSYLTLIVFTCSILNTHSFLELKYSFLGPP